MNALHDALSPAGPQAQHIAELWWLTLAITGAFFLAVLVPLIVALRRRSGASEQTPADISSLTAGEPRARRIVIAAVGASALGLFVLLAASVLTDRALARLPLADALQMEVAANQWWWDIRYTDPDPSRAFSTANEMHIPVGRPISISLKANDVIHSFWTPSLHGKKDLIPGRIATITLRADAPGVYRGQCAEFCGVQHAFMAFVVIAEPPEQYERWAQAQRAPGAEPANAEQAKGRELFLSGSCMLCHNIAGTPATGRTAPDLTHVASRSRLAAGTLANNPVDLRAWIEDPQRFKPGVNMPAHHIREDEMAALVAYLGALK